MMTPALRRTAPAMVVLALWVLGLCYTGAAYAQILVSPPPEVSGPGGTGAAQVDDDDPTFLFVEKTYDNLDYLDVTFSVGSSTAYGIVEFITNNTGTTWSGFTYDLIEAPAGSQFFIAFDLSGQFADLVLNNGPLITSFSFVNGTVPDGDGFTPLVGLFASDAGSITIRQTPTVPEPGSLAMLLSGIAGLYLLRRRRSPAES